MMSPYVNIHTHRPTGQGIELRCAGIHPWQASDRSVDELLPLPEGIQAIGEIGLDNLRGADAEVQRAVFDQQLSLAEHTGLPVVIHCVRALDQILRTLDRYNLRAVIFHGFIGSPQQALRALKKGYYLSFGERAFASPRTLEALRTTPLDALFLETDDSIAPIEQIYARAAEARSTSVEELRRATEANYRKIFG